MREETSALLREVTEVCGNSAFEIEERAHRASGPTGSLRLSTALRRHIGETKKVRANAPAQNFIALNPGLAQMLDEARCGVSLPQRTHTSLGFASNSSTTSQGHPLMPMYVST